MQTQSFAQYGEPTVLVARNAPAPHPGAGEVRVRVAYAAVNALDGKIRSGALAGMFPAEPPLVLGTEVAGIVDEVGEGVTTLAVGERVAGFTPLGGYAEYAVTTPERLAVVPAGLSLERAATLPTAVETARRGLALIEIASGDTVLVNAAAGSVGAAVVQLLVARGVRVLGSASPANHEYVRALGGAPVRYGEQLLDDVRRVAPDGVDAAFDAGGRGFVDQALTLLAPEQIVTIVDFPAGAQGVRVAGGDPTAVRADGIEEALVAALDGRFATEIAAVMPLTDAAEAHRMSATGHSRGKLLLRVAELEGATSYGGGQSAPA